MIAPVVEPQIADCVCFFCKTDKTPLAIYIGFKDMNLFNYGNLIQFVLRKICATCSDIGYGAYADIG